MGYWWFGLSTFLHFNAIIILVAVLPFPTPRQWKYILEFRLFRFFIELINFDLWKIYLIIACPCLMVFIDSITEYYKSSTFDFKSNRHSQAVKDAYSALFFAQRNYFISGGVCFLCIFFPRLVTILKENATLAVKMSTLKNATKLFRELILVMQIERNIEKKGGVELVLLEALKTELEKLHKENDIKSKSTDGTPQLSDIKTILKIYETRMASAATHNQQQSTGRGYPDHPLLRRRQTMYSTYNLNNGYPYYHGQSYPHGLSHPLRINRRGLVDSDSD